MPLTLKCPGCPTVLKVGDDLAGRKSKCPTCGTVFQIPGAAPPAPAPYTGAPPPARSSPPRPPAPPPALDEPPTFLDQAPPEAAPPTRRKGLPPVVLLSAAAGGGLLLLAGAAGLVWWLFFSGSGIDDDVTYLPSDSQLVGSLRVDQLVNSEFYKQIKKEIGGDDAESFEKGLEKTSGLAVANIERITYGGLISGSTEYVVVVRTKQPVKAADLIANNKHTGFKEAKVGRFSLQENGADSFCVVEDRRVIYGDAKALRAVLERDKKPELSDGLRAAMKQTDFGQTLAVAVNFKDLRDKLPDLGPSKEAMEAVGFDIVNSIDGLAVKANVGADAAVSVTVVCGDAKGAEDVRKVLDGALVLARRSKAVPKELADLLDAPTSVSGSNVTLSQTVKADTVVKLYKDGKLIPRAPTKPAQ
jgi:hypothetical protein